MHSLACLFVVILSLGSALPAAVTVDDIRLGTYIAGPQRTVSALHGEVVLYLTWGVSCPRCHAAIAHIAGLKDEFGDRVTIIGSHRQFAEPAQIKKVWFQHGGTASDTIVDFGIIEGGDSDLFPHATVFDHTGAVVFAGSPMEIAGPLRDACQRYPGKLAIGYEWKHLLREAHAIGRQEGPIAGAIKSVRRALESDDQAVRSEADELFRRLSTFVETSQAEMEQARTADPVAAWTTAATMAELLQGDDLADAFIDAGKDMKRDRAFQNELKAAAALSKIESAADDAGVSTGSADARSAAACKQALEKLIKRFEGTKAATQAAELITTWKL